MLLVNQKVISKKTGLPAVGQIIGMLPATVFLSYYRNGKDFDNPTWDDLYPDWREKYVYYVRLNEPMVPCNPAEFERLPDKAKKSGKKIIKYKEQVRSDLVVYVEDDLEVFDEE